jgi:hypothetical protein
MSMIYLHFSKVNIGWAIMVEGSYKEWGELLEIRLLDKK